MEQLISVIIPVFNVEKYLNRCVASILSQDYKKLEIILVDDGSTDTSGEICDKLATQDKRIVVLHKKNEGAGVARNYGLDVSKGQYIFFCDSDDYIADGIIRELYILSQKYNADIVCCGFQSGVKKYYTRGKMELWTGMQAVKNMLITRNIDSNTGCKLYKRYLFDNIRYLGGTYEDVPVTYRILLKAERVISYKKCGYFVNKRVDSTTRTQFSKKHVRYIELSKNTLENIMQEYPFLSKEAKAFYYNAVICVAEHASESIIKGVLENEVISVFRSNFFLILFSKYISLRKKVISILIYLNIYKEFKDFLIKWENKRIK